MKTKGNPETINEEDDISVVSDADEFIRRYSIQQQITRGVALILGIIASIAAVCVFILGRYYIIHDAGQRYEEIAHSSALFVHQSFIKHAQLLEQISENRSLQASLASKEPALFEDQIGHIMARYTDIEGIWILTRDGNVFTYNHSKEQGGINWGGLVTKNYAMDEWFYKCINSKVPQFYSDRAGMVTDETNLPKNLYLWTQPISDGKGCILVFENSTLISDYVYKKITFVRKNLKLKSIQAHILGSDGQVMYSTDSDWNSYIGNKDKFNPVGKYIKSASLGTDTDKIHKRNVLFSWCNIKDNLFATESLFWNGSIVIQVDMKEIIKPLYYLLFLLIGLVAFVTSTASYLSYSRSKKLVHFPIQEMDERMEFAAQGDLSFDDLKITQKNDIGMLAFNMNLMIRRIRNLLLMILENGKAVMSDGKEFFLNLGLMQAGALKIKNLLNQATETVKQINQVSEQIYHDAMTQQSIASTNRAAMDEVKVSFEKSGNKRMEITQSAKNVVQRSNSGLQTIGEFANNVEKIAESSQKIRGIINIIDNISDQTNLLALNASIEAARAGVHGQGFSVVANEISDLAKRSARSAEEITALIKETVQQVMDVSNKVENAKGFFKQIAEMMIKLDKEIIEMANFTAQQETSVLATATRAQQNAKISQKISEITKKQTEQAEYLLTLMSDIGQLSIESTREIEKDDQLLQNFMHKIQTLMESANQFKLTKETILRNEEVIKNDENAPNI